MTAPTTTTAAKKPASALWVVFKIVALVSVGGFVIVALVGALTGQNAASPKPDILRVDAGRGPAGISLTSKEDRELSRCHMEVLDQGKEWIAMIEQRLQPSQTVSIPWDAFKQNGQPMPGYLGRARDNVTVTCFLGPGELKSAGIRF